uniref:Sulfotransferase n=1 Tax=Amphilophus citrinellus TaxID=61819 RepID=A0A3Q0QTQ9_AMPCI
MKTTRRRWRIPRFSSVVLPSRPELFHFHGVSMTHIFTDNWENIQNFQARRDDILIATYPNIGTTWVSQILDLLYFCQTSPERQKTIPFNERVPLLDICVPTLKSGKDLVDKLPTSPRLIKTHFPVQFVPKSFWEQKRIVHVARNAKDNMVSFHFDHMNRVESEFMEGKMVFGSWYDHVNGWWKKKQTCSKIHYMFYEDLIEDTEQEIDKLSCFLDLTPSAEEKKMIAGGVQFDNMKNNEMANQSTSPIFDFKISPFMRKDMVGDWKNHFKIKCSMKTTRRR